jgi:CHAT domain-containing protein/Tfp pilus assembly protein PilF
MLLSFVRDRVLFRGILLFGLISLTALPTFAQSASSNRVDSEQELLLALLKVQQEKPTGTAALLRANVSLVTPSLWQELNERAARTYYQNQPDQCLRLYDIAKQVALQLNSQKLLARTYYNVGRTYSGLSQYERARASYLESHQAFAAAGMRRDLIYILSDLGTISFILEDYVKAKDYSEQCLRLAESLRTSNAPLGLWPDEYGVAGALATLGELAMREGDFAQAIEELQRSLALYQALNNGGSDYDYYLVEVYAALGRVYTTAGDHGRALLFLDKALAKTPSSSTQAASLLNSIGYLYMEQEDYSQARAHFDRSLKIYRADNNQREIARVLLNLGVIEQRQSNYDEALTRFRASLQAAKATQSIDVMLAASEGMGVVLAAKKDFAGALETFGKALVIANDHKDRTRKTELLWRSAETYYEMGNYDEAVSHAESAAALARASYLRKVTYLATTTLGQSYAAQKKPEIATETLKQAVEQLEMMRDQVAGGEGELQLFFENKIAAYHALVDLLVKQGKPLDALLYAERAKGRVLLDVLSNGKPDVAKVLTPGEKEETQRLNRRISEINNRIKTEETASSSSLNSLYTQLDASRLEYQSFQNALYVAHPNLSTRSGRTAALTTADVNGLTRDNDTAYLEYVVDKDRVYLFVLTKDKLNGASDLRVHPIAIKPEDLLRKVDKFHDMLADRNPAYASAARELYAILIAPAEQQLGNASTLCIVPDGFLWNVPFQALMTASDRFLIEDRALYYAPSLSVLREMNKTKAISLMMDSSLIAFGNPVIGKDEQRNADLCPLPEAETEVTSVAKTLGPRVSKILIGRDASEKTFKALAPTYSVIHLATHGVIDNRHPLYSHLLLTKTEGDPDNDGLLEAREIMDMNLHADLAVLSACETANGKISPGEGVIGMSWAFFVAGTRSMLVSQWKVNSASTSKFMIEFYKSLDTNKDRKAKSARNPAIKLIKDGGYHHPFYWAGFVLIGSN